MSARQGVSAVTGRPIKPIGQLSEHCDNTRCRKELLSKSPRYYYNADAIAEPSSPNTHARCSQDLGRQIRSARANGGSRADRPMKEGVSNNPGHQHAVLLPVAQRNKRTVWTIGSSPFKGAHFATFPEALVEPCVLAGSAFGDVVLDPFAGAGTTGLVADRLGRSALLIELNSGIRGARRITPARGDAVVVLGGSRSMTAIL